MKKPPAFNNINFNKKKIRIGICVSGWNNNITEKLYSSTIKTLINSGLSTKNITTIRVPGSYELTTASYWLAMNKKIDGIIALGCIIKGETDHDKYIAQALANGLLSVSIISGKPVIFGVLTTHNFKQAKERAGGKKGNKGQEAAYALLEMLNVKSRISS